MNKADKIIVISIVGAAIVFICVVIYLIYLAYSGAAAAKEGWQSL